MNSLPSSIESYLKETGFSATEILILNKLMEGESLTLRQIAAKTGKSTGVLDQALKKLLRRNIVTRESVNETGKYALVSLQSISEWVHRDMREKQELMKRRHENFESFIQTLKVDHKRPEMQFYEGDDGIQQAYRRLLSHTKEMLHYFPVVTTAEEDPLRDFRVQYFRERRAQGVFARYIVHNTPLGRRFASRDPFEYRKTLLIPEQSYPITFEKVIAGDIVACFNHAEKRVCFLRYPELADTERRLFERIWYEQERAAPPLGPAPEPAPAPQIALSTRVLSSLREFLLSRKSLAIFALFAIAAAVTTYGLYYQNYALTMQRLRERAMSIAATGALQFDARDLDKLRVKSDYKRPEYAKVVNKLKEIRSLNDGVAYAWIMRPTKKNGYLEYVADADSLDPFAKIDGNYDGVIDETDQLQYPGFPYEEFDPYIEIENKEVFSTPEIHVDTWGTYFTTTAPIRDSNGNTVAHFGIDIQTAEASLVTWQSFNYFLCFVSLFLLFVIIRLAAFNRSLFVEVWKAFNLHKVLLSLALAAEVAFFITLGMYYYTRNLLWVEMNRKLLAVAATAANQFDSNDLNQIHFARDMRKEAYQRVFRKLNEIRDSNQDTNIKWVYILRPSYGEYMWEFVADADTNVDIPLWRDWNEDGMQDIDELISPPGMQNYQKDAGIGDIQLALSKPLIDDTEFGNDQWGALLSASAPILDRHGKPIAIIGIDADYTEVVRLHNEKFIFSLWFTGFFALMILFGSLAIPLFRATKQSI